VKAREAERAGASESKSASNFRSFATAIYFCISGAIAGVCREFGVVACQGRPEGKRRQKHQ